MASCESETGSSLVERELRPSCETSAFRAAHVRIFRSRINGLSLLRIMRNLFCDASGLTLTDHVKTVSIDRIYVLVTPC